MIGHGRTLEANRDAPLVTAVPCAGVVQIRARAPSTKGELVTGHFVVRNSSGKGEFFFTAAKPDFRPGKEVRILGAGADGAYLGIFWMRGGTMMMKRMMDPPRHMLFSLSSPSNELIALLCVLAPKYGVRFCAKQSCCGRIVM